MQMRSSVDALTHDYEYNNNNNINNTDAKKNNEGHPWSKFKAMAIYLLTYVVI